MTPVSLRLEGGFDEYEEGYATQERLLGIFQDCLQLQQEKALTYGDAYRSQGYMGNVARVLSKVARLKKMVWTGHETRSSEETIIDTMNDLINLAGFFIINYNDNNKWGSNE